MHYRYRLFTAISHIVCPSLLIKFKKKRCFTMETRVWRRGPWVEEIHCYRSGPYLIRVIACPVTSEKNSKMKFKKTPRSSNVMYASIIRAPPIPPPSRRPRVRATLVVRKGLPPARGIATITAVVRTVVKEGVVVVVVAVGVGCGAILIRGRANPGGGGTR